jgi:hypothetical protein
MTSLRLRTRRRTGRWAVVETDASDHSTGRADDALQINMQASDQAGNEHGSMVAYAGQIGHHPPVRT